MRRGYQVGRRPHALPHLNPARGTPQRQGNDSCGCCSQSPATPIEALGIALERRCYMQSRIHHMHVCKQQRPTEGLADANACGRAHRLSLLSEAPSVTVSVIAAAPLLRPSRAAQLTLRREHPHSAPADHRTRDSRLVPSRPWGRGRLRGFPASAALCGWDAVPRLLRRVCSAERPSSPRPSRNADLCWAGIAAAVHDERHAPRAGTAGWGDRLLRLQAAGTSAQWARCKGSGLVSGAGKYVSVQPSDWCSGDRPGGREGGGRNAGATAG